uniref:Uncharacterized protein n=1 Tax=Caenorhabditis tropicalis TaxID=1561998 RepID=A0A1I7UJH8_9PELO
MIRFVLQILLFLAYFDTISTQNPEIILCPQGGNATIPLPVSANYRRTVQDANFKDEEHLYRVCNGKNQKTCGFWENVKTKKKMASGKTQYNKNKKTLIIRNVLATDFGTYMTGNKKQSKILHKLIVKG